MDKEKVFMGPREKEVIKRAIKNLEEETHTRVTAEIFEKDVDVFIKIDEHNLVFNAEVRLFLNKARLGLVLNQKRTHRGIPLLITEHVNPELMIHLVNNGVNFIDAAGNAYINEPPLFIKIKGNKREENKRTKNIERPFYTAALQTIFTILCNPGIETKPVREIAELAGVAHGTAHITLKELERQGYLLLNNQTRLINKKDLLERWVVLYPEKLKPKYILGKYKAENEQINNIDILNFDALWGGEAAAAKLTNYLQPFIYTIYIGDRQGEFILKNRLRKHPQGNLELIKKFWKFQNNEHMGITPPILVYADLLATGDPRNIETAQIIYEKDIARYIEKD
jgi:hypothetical protein